MGMILDAYSQYPWLLASLCLIGGSVAGSFLNVVAIRIPLGESVIAPPSHCRSCGCRLNAIDLLPVLGYLIRRGRCRNCRQPFSAEYAVWEGLAGLLFAGMSLALGLTRELAVGLFLVSVLLVVVQTDMRHLLIPDKIVYPSMMVALLLRLWTRPLPLWEYGAAFFLGGGLLWGIGWLGERLLRKEAMGGGDIKLVALLGLVLGIRLTLLLLFAASLLGLFVGGIARMLGKIGRGQAIPFAPFLAGGALCSYLWGDAAWQWYVSMVLHV